MQKSQQSFTMLFELGPENVSASVSRPTLNELNSSTLAQIAQKVASSGTLFNIINPVEWLEEHQDIEPFEDITQTTSSILCMPIVNGKSKVIGVVQLINKVRYFSLNKHQE